MNSRDSGRQVEILLIEDNPDDVELTLASLEESKIGNQVHVVADGLAALDFLQRRNGHESAPQPDLILLDLNLPRMNGHEVLEVIKEDPTLRRIPVVVLTTSEADEDILKAYDLHVNCYITKPIDLEQFVKVTRAVEEFWFTIVKLPTE
ncbi:MAG: response regulator [Thermoanaerobaculia bacterium]|nr:response regulator [Thermoanaerobaculia bacterium]